MPTITALKAKIIREAVAKYPEIPNRTLSRYILNTNRGLFHDIEKIRSSVRYRRGKVGVRNKQRAEKAGSLLPSNVKMPSTWRETRTPYQLPVGLWAIFQDLHVPFHEPVPVESAIKAAQVERVDGILFNGDLWDCQSVSYWPQVHRDFNAEMELMVQFLDFMRTEFPEQKIVWKPGNHEFRLPRLFMAKAPELAATPLASWESEMGLETRGIELLDYYQPVMAGKLPIFHGHEVGSISKAVNAARGLFLRLHSYAACGHCHTTSMHPGSNWKGEALTTWSFGCMCDLSPDYSAYGNNWNWGFALINIEKNGDFEVVNRRILESGEVV